MSAFVPSLFSALAAFLTAAAPPFPPETQAERQVVRAFEHLGRTAPVRDPALDAAAQALAQVELSDGSVAAGDPLRIAHEVSTAGGFAPSPRAFVFRASPASETLRALEARRDLADEAAGVMGVGYVERKDVGALVVLVTERKASLEAFPRTLASVGAATPPLCGSLSPPLDKPLLFVTFPSGRVEKSSPASGRGGRFCFSPRFPTEGRYTVEVLGTGPAGPEVAALFFTEVGHVDSRPTEALGAEPHTTGEAIQAVTLRINRLREANGAQSLVADASLSTVAQAYADRMAREHFFAHVSPEGATLDSRLAASGYRYQHAGENLGLAQGPLAAHFGIEHSPGHRQNLLTPSFGKLGLGMAWEHVSGREQLILVELFAQPPNASNDPLGDAYRSFSTRRTSLHLTPLNRSAVLESLAIEQAKRALANDEPKAELPGESLHERVFKMLPEVQRASIDLYVTQDLAHLPASKSGDDAANDLVGIGAVLGDSARYGKNRYWVVVIYAGDAP
jgi:uncharacterized protein YkwD